MAESTPCSDPELKDLQDNPELKTKQHIELVIMSDPTIKKIIDNSTYCEFMSLATTHSENGTYGTLNVNLNNSKNLVIQVSLQNDSVVSYKLLNLERTFPAIVTSPFDFILPYLIIGGSVGGTIVIILIWKNRNKKSKSDLSSCPNGLLFVFQGQP